MVRSGVAIATSTKVLLVSGLDFSYRLTRNAIGRTNRAERRDSAAEPLDKSTDALPKNPRVIIPRIINMA